MPTRLRYPEFAPEGVATLRATEHYLNAATALPAVLLELVRLRVSLDNGCDFCIGHHTAELRKHNEPDTRIEGLQSWRNSDAFTPRERAALAWADGVTEIRGQCAGDAEYLAVSEFFHEKDLVDLTLAIASINAWNRMSIAFRAEWDSRLAGRHAAAPSAQAAHLAIAAQTVSQTKPAHEKDSTRGVLNGDGDKVAQD